MFLQPHYIGKPLTPTLLQLRSLDEGRFGFTTHAVNRSHERMTENWVRHEIRNNRQRNFYSDHYCSDRVWMVTRTCSILFSESMESIITVVRHGYFSAHHKVRDTNPIEDEFAGKRARKVRK